MIITLFEDFKYQSSIDDITIQLREFLSRPFPRNKWLFSDNISIYVRQSKRSVNGEYLEFLDLATIDIEPMGEEIFINLLDRIEKEFHTYNIFIESIQSDRFLRFFLKKGYVRTVGIDDCVYKLSVVS